MTLILRCPVGFSKCQIKQGPYSKRLAGLEIILKLNYLIAHRPYIWMWVKCHGLIKKMSIKIIQTHKLHLFRFCSLNATPACTHCRQPEKKTTEHKYTVMTNTQNHLLNHLLNTTSGCVWFVSCSMLPASALNQVQAAFLLLYFKVQFCPPEPFMTRSFTLGPFLLTLLIFKITASLGESITAFIASIGRRYKQNAGEIHLTNISPTDTKALLCPEIFGQRAQIWTQLEFILHDQECGKWWQWMSLRGFQRFPARQWVKMNLSSVSAKSVLANAGKQSWVLQYLQHFCGTFQIITIAFQVNILVSKQCCIVTYFTLQYFVCCFLALTLLLTQFLVSTIWQISNLSLIYDSFTFAEKLTLA